MSNADFHPIAEGVRMEDAVTIVDRLLDHAGDRKFVTVDINIATDSHAGLRRCLSLIPAAHDRQSFELHPTPDTAQQTATLLGPLTAAEMIDDGQGGFWLPLHRDGHAALAALADLPPIHTEVNVSTLPLTEFDWALVPAIGAEPAVVEWKVGWWPAVPEIDLPPDVKHAGIVLVVNSSDFWDLIPAPGGYRLYVSTGGRKSLHASCVAHAVGHKVIGPRQLGW